MSPLKRDQLGIYLWTFFVVGNFGNTEAMSVIFFIKCSKFNADSKNSEKNSEKTLCFWDKCIWIVCIQLSLLVMEYLSSGVNVLRKRKKNFHVSKSDFCNSIHFKVFTQDNKGALTNIESLFQPVYHVASQWEVSNGTS